MIPQSIAYASLAGLTPQYGLYSSFVGGFIYVFFGTIKEVSIGATSLMSLVTAEYTHDMPIDYVVLLSFMAGCVELLMGLLNLGFLVDFISLPVTSSFTSATSIIIVLSQLPGLLGLRIRSERILEIIYKTFKQKSNIRYNDTILGIMCIIFLLLFRKLKDIDCTRIKQINLKFGLLMEKIFWFLSVSRNALIVFITSYLTFIQQHDNGELIFLTAGNVKQGLPKITLPPFTTSIGNVTYNFQDMCTNLGSGIIMIPLIAVLTNVAIAKAFVTDRPVEATQEMLTLGVCNIAGSFVSSMPTCGAFTRSAVSSASGIQTPMAGIYSGVLTLLALSFLTPYFGFIPRATLSAVLMTAVIFLIDLKIIKILWKGNKKDFFVAGMTFFICIIYNVETGLLCGTATNALFLLYLSARPNVEVHLRQTILGHKYVLVKPEVGLFYPAVSFLTAKITRISQREAECVYPVVVDFERFQGIDYTATKGIERLVLAFEGKSQKLIFLQVNQYVAKSISNFGLMKNVKFIDNEDRLLEILQDESVETNYIIPTLKELAEKSDSADKNFRELNKESLQLPEQQALLKNKNDKK
ncbi:sodium-independent sulfate anion transporter-like [Aphidius gifuensis]|nr:sodium-independent sulfate anion transporter-like [Aphidius gifuensis]